MSLLGLLHPTPVQAAATAYKQDFGTSSVLPCFLCSGHRTILNSLPQTPLPPGAVLPCSPPQNSPVFPDGTPRSSFLCPPNTWFVSPWLQSWHSASNGQYLVTNPTRLSIHWIWGGTFIRSSSPGMAGVGLCTRERLAFHYLNLEFLIGWSRWELYRRY